MIENMTKTNLNDYTIIFNAYILIDMIIFIRILEVCII